MVRVRVRAMGLPSCRRRRASTCEEAWAKIGTFAWVRIRVRVGFRARSRVKSWGSGSG